MSNKPTVIFTTFWHADKMLEKDENIVVHSVALSHPPLTKLKNINKHFKPFVRLDMFCPTPEILFKYKEDKDWRAYVKEYRKLLSQRKKEIKGWVKSLEDDKTYALCCWENTSVSAQCHRWLIYYALTDSKTMKDKAIYVCKHGNEEI